MAACGGRTEPSLGAMVDGRLPAVVGACGAAALEPWF